MDGIATSLKWTRRHWRCNRAARMLAATLSLLTENQNQQNKNPDHGFSLKNENRTKTEATWQ